jgi:beta-phosphoglucomutase family hydrolase
LNKKDVRAVIWDMDGVVADTGEQHYESWKYAFGRQGVDFRREDFLHVFGQRNDTIIRKMMGEDVSDEIIQQTARDKEEYFRESVVKDLKPLPGVIELLKVLAENGIAAAIASSAPMENIQVILRGLGIERYFQALVYGAEVSEGKPSPKIFLLAARKLGAEPSRCVVIEDAVAGVTAAKRAGMRCIAVTNTHPAESLREADLVVDSLEKVSLHDLEKLFREQITDK